MTYTDDTRQCTGLRRSSFVLTAFSTRHIISRCYEVNNSSSQPDEMSTTRSSLSRETVSMLASAPTGMGKGALAPPPGNVESDFFQSINRGFI